jgi:hypothetical protein
MFGITVKYKMRRGDRQGIGVIEGSDQQSHGVPNCQHKIDDALVVIFKQDIASVEKYHIKR